VNFAKLGTSAAVLLSPNLKPRGSSYLERRRKVGGGMEREIG